MGKPGSTVALASLVALALAGCGGGSSTGAAEEAGGRPTAVTATMLADLTGGAAFCGVAARTGAETAVKKINEERRLGETTLELAVEDTATDPRQAASLMSRVAGGDSQAVLFGCASQVAQAIAPVAQDEGVPLVAMQSGSDGVLDAGEYLFRSTAPQASYQDVVVDRLVEQGVRSAAVVYQAENPTLVELAEDTYPGLFASAGISIVASEKFQGTGFDFAALTSSVAGRSPDVVVMLGQGTPNVTVITQLRQAGFTGPVVGSASFSADVLAPLGGQANGALWASDFNVAGSAPSTQEFVSYFRSVNGSDPSQFAAQAWDAVMLLAAGIEAAETLDREGVRAGLETAAARGFDGAVGPVTFEDRDARVGGVLVTWQDGREQLVG
ncbi:ABC transporter substrate-binding protein [Pseudonocardia sichuanensis]